MSFIPNYANSLANAEIHANIDKISISKRNWIVLADLISTNIDLHFI